MLTIAASTLRDLSNCRVTVMGLGAFGGGAAAVRFLCERGAVVRVSDQRTSEQLAPTIESLKEVAGIDWRLGGHDWSHFSDADFVVVNPAVTPQNPILQRLGVEQIPVTSELSMFWLLNRGRVVAVTGSNGKSTTTALTHSLIAASGQQCWLGGNIGRSLLPHVDEISNDDVVVLEVSSFQLEQLNSIHARPSVAIVTNFSPNHLDWHGTLDSYRSAKQALLRWQTADDWCVLNATDRDVTHWEHQSRCLRFGTSTDRHAAWLESGVASVRIDGTLTKVAVSGKLRLRGQHNQDNALAAIAAALLMNVDATSIERGLREFEPLPHRLQLVAEASGRRFFNDSIATTPESAMAGLNSFDEPIVLLAGGYDKQVDLCDFARSIAQRVKAVALLGQTAEALNGVIERERNELPRLIAGSFAEAFEWATAQTSPGDVVLLSPGCASYGWFRSFEHRGQVFADLARATKFKPEQS